jgi:hypothetical protein
MNVYFEKNQSNYEEELQQLQTQINIFQTLVSWSYLIWCTIDRQPSSWHDENLEILCHYYNYKSHSDRINDWQWGQKRVGSKSSSFTTYLEKLESIKLRRTNFKNPKRMLQRKVGKQEWSTKRFWSCNNKNINRLTLTSCNYSKRFELTSSCFWKTLNEEHIQ